MIKRPPYKPINKFMNRIILSIKILATVRRSVRSSCLHWYLGTSWCSIHARSGHESGVIFDFSECAVRETVEYVCDLEVNGERRLHLGSAQSLLAQKRVGGRSRG